jgi:hypothetical protein
MIFGTKRVAVPHPDPRQGDLRIKITCPLCGVTSVGNANEVINWQTEHPCRRAQKKVAA